jgi:hypothetical protein
MAFRTAKGRPFYENTAHYLNNARCFHKKVQKSGLFTLNLFEKGQHRAYHSDCYGLYTVEVGAFDRTGNDSTRNDSTRYPHNKPVYNSNVNN